jgi:splicing factor 3B subunit 3
MQARKWSDPVDNGANMLIPVPGGADGPGGVLVCAENFIIYKNQDHEEVRVTRKLWTLLVVLHWLFNANTF